jgi:hypothetical protein
MPSGNPSRLLALADREFRELTNKPLTIEPTRKFKAVKLNVARFDSRAACMRERALGKDVCRRDGLATTGVDPSVQGGQAIGHGGRKACSRSHSLPGRPALTDFLADGQRARPQAAL